MKGGPQRKECGSCCGPGDGLGGHRQGEEVGVGCLSFDIGWPPGVHDSGSAAGGWVKKGCSETRAVGVKGMSYALGAR